MCSSDLTGPKMDYKMPLEDAIQQLANAKKDIAVVVDRAGRTIGQITMRAVIEAMARPNSAAEGQRYK